MMKRGGVGTLRAVFDGGIEAIARPRSLGGRTTG